MIELKIGQVWRSETHPHEDIVIYDGTYDGFVLSDMEIYVVNSFENLPEKAKIFFWKRASGKEFDEFVKSKKGEEYESTYPYAFAGECKRSGLIRKINKFNMKLQ